MLSHLLRDRQASIHLVLYGDAWKVETEAKVALLAALRSQQEDVPGSIWTAGFNALIKPLLGPANLSLVEEWEFLTGAREIQAVATVPVPATVVQ